MVYAAHLWRSTHPSGDRAVAPRAGWLAVVEWAGVFVLVGLSMFWAANDYSAAVGRSRARQFVAELPIYPRAVVYSERSLNLHAPGVREVRCQNQEAAYRFRYDGLKLVLQSATSTCSCPRPGPRPTGSPSSCPAPTPSAWSSSRRPPMMGSVPAASPSSRCSRADRRRHADPPARFTLQTVPWHHSLPGGAAFRQARRRSRPVGCAKAFMQLAGICGADRVDPPRPVDPRRQPPAQQVGPVPQARAIDADDAGCSARHRPARPAPSGFVLRSGASPGTRRGRCGPDRPNALPCGSSPI